MQADDRSTLLQRFSYYAEEVIKGLNASSFSGQNITNILALSDQVHQACQLSRPDFSSAVSIDIPNEIILSIFEFLDPINDQESFHTLRLVNKSFADLISPSSEALQNSGGETNGYLGVRVKIDSKTTATKAKNRLENLKKIPSFKALKIYVSSCTKQKISVVRLYLQALKEKQISQVSLISPLNDISFELGNSLLSYPLKSLKIYRFYNIPWVTQLVSLEKLVIYSSKDHLNIDNEAINNFSENFSNLINLKSLSFHCGGYIDVNTDKFNFPPNLKKLTINPRMESLVYKLKNHPTLESLSFYPFHNYPGNYGEILRSLPALVSLDLRTLSKINSQIIESLYEIKGLKRLFFNSISSGTSTTDVPEVNAIIN